MSDLNETWATNEGVIGVDDLKEVIDITEASVAKDDLKNLNEVIHIEYSDKPVVTNLNESKDEDKKKKNSEDD